MAGPERRSARLRAQSAGAADSDNAGAWEAFRAAVAQSRALCITPGNGMGAIHWACYTGTLELVRRLLQARR